MAPVRGENDRAILLEGDRGLALVHHLQLRAHGVEHDSAELLGGLDGELEVLQRLLVVRGVPPREIEPGDGHAGLEAGGDRVDGARLGAESADPECCAGARAHGDAAAGGDGVRASQVWGGIQGLQLCIHLGTERAAHGAAEGRDRRALPRRGGAAIPAQPGKKFREG